MPTCCLTILSSGTTNIKLNGTFGEALRLVCKNNELKVEKLKERYVTFHQHNLQLLMVAIFKTKSNLNPTFIKVDLYRESFPIQFQR